MNTYVQDEKIPIYIILQYEMYSLQFPVNPESIKKDVASAANTEEVEGIGQISIPKTPELARISINSFFWQGQSYISAIQDKKWSGNNITPSSMYVEWLEQWQRSKKPANLIITRLNYSMKVTCENFSHWINAGEESDIYFSLDLLEYRPHGAKKLTGKKNSNLLEKLKTINNLKAFPAVYQIPRRTRDEITKPAITNPYTVKRGDTLLTITRKITNSSEEWKKLYDANKTELGDAFDFELSIKEGTKLTLPEEWTNSGFYQIVREGA